MKHHVLSYTVTLFYLDNDRDVSYNPSNLDCWPKQSLAWMELGQRRFAYTHYAPGAQHAKKLFVLAQEIINYVIAH